MAGPPPPSEPRDPRDPVDPVDETIVRDGWGEETVVVDEVVEEAPVRRPPTIWPWLLLLLLVVLGGLGALYYFNQKDDESATTTGTTTAEQVAAPSVVGVREARARELVREAGLQSTTREEAGSKPKGVVMAQQPDAGAMVDRGGSILLTISKGPPKEQVPDVVGEQSSEALDDLTAAGFKADVTQAFADQPAGVIVKQAPAGGTTLKEGSSVALVASKGPEPAPVPSVVGQQASEATATLREAGFEATVVTVPSDQPNGSVVAQKPAAGKSATKGSKVRINVAQNGGGSTTSAGTTTTAGTTTSAGTTTAPPAQPAKTSVPDAVGQELADAARAFGQAGLKVAVQPVPSSEPTGRVVAQAQPPGTERRRGDTVQINVSTGPDPAPSTGVPNVVGEAQDRGRQRLVDAGFETLSITFPTADATQVGKVLSQTPAARANIPQGFLVITYVGVAR